MKELLNFQKFVTFEILILFVKVQQTAERSVEKAFKI